MYSIASFWPSTATSRWLPVKWRHFRVTSGHLKSHVVSCHGLPPPASDRFVASEMYNIWVFVLVQPLPGDFWSNDVTYGSLPVKWRHFRVTSGRLRSYDIISWHVTASSCKQPPCWKWNVQYTGVFGLQQPLPGNFRSNDVTSGSVPITWGHVTSFPVTWLPPANYSLVRCEMYIIREFLAFYSHFQDTSGQMTSLSGQSRSPQVTWRHFLSRDCLLLRATAL